jgi:beta-galactosidase
LEPRPGTQILATYSDQFYKGSAAAVSHKVGKGRVIYIGVDSNNGDFEADLIHQIYNKIPALPLNFTVDWRDGFWVASNFTDIPQMIPAQMIPANAQPLFGKRLIPPGETAIWQ